MTGNPGPIGYVAVVKAGSNLGEDAAVMSWRDGGHCRRGPQSDDRSNQGILDKVLTGLIADKTR